MSTEYKHDEFIYFIEESTGKFEETGAKGGSTRLRPIKQSRNIKFDEIDNLDLEKRGEQVPFTHKHVVNTPLYMLYYWSPIIGDRACWLYLELLTYCREDRDFLWDKLDEIGNKCKISRPTLNKHLDILEENNFIIKIHRLNKLDNHRQTSPIIKVRQTIPLLSIEQYAQLDKRNQKHHDDFMSKYGKSVIMKDRQYDHQKTINEIAKDSEVRVTNRMKKKLDKILREDNAINYISKLLSEKHILITKEFHRLISDCNHFSKASYETWLEGSFIVFEEDYGIVDVVLNDFGRETFSDSKDRYDKKLSPTIEKVLELDSDSFTIRYYSFEQYMLKLERGL